MKNLIPISGMLSNSSYDMFMRVLEIYKNFLKEKELSIIVNCAGGESKIATGIYLKLESLKKEGWIINTIGDGNIKSSGLLIFMAGSKRSLYEGTKVMYHQHFKPVSFELNIKSTEGLIKAARDSKLFEEVKTIEKNNEKIDNVFQEVAGISPEKLQQIADIDLTADQALELGFATEIIYK
ncbi:MAG: ATP-dependent protease ClpP protease subunit [Candidatus Paceibacteria bacterium]|jgi:ATP-dependent protease ClpP protease subunit